MNPAQIASFTATQASLMNQGVSKSSGGCGSLDVTSFEMLLTLFIAIYGVQIFVVFMTLIMEEFDNRSDFILNLIPFYWIYSRIKDLD